MKQLHHTINIQEIWKDKLKLPSQENTIFLDIETDPAHRVWLIGVLYEFQLHQFIAKTMKEEVVILRKFRNFLKKNLHIPIMSYSGTYFDFRIILNRAKVLGVDLLSVLSHRLWIDLCIELRKVCDRSGSYQLKELAKYYDYPLNHNLDGHQVSSLYKDRIGISGRLDDDFASIALEYNADDILLLPFLITKFEDNVEENTNFDPIPAKDILTWISTHSKLIHRKSSAITIFFSKNHEVDAFKYLGNICIPPKVKVSKFHISFTWENFSKDVISEFLSLNLSG